VQRAESVGGSLLRPGDEDRGDDADIGVAALRIAFTVVAYAARRWTWPVATVNAALDAAFAIPAVWLLQTEQLLSPAVKGEMERVGAAMAPTVAVVSVAIIGAVAWDALDGFRTARRSGGS
jgi:hypothetical protein